MDNFTWDLMGGLAMSGIVVSLMNIQTAILLGMSVLFLVVGAMFIASLSLIRSDLGIPYQLLEKSGGILALFILIGFYTVCVFRNNDYISDNNMPDSWYLFSYFTVIVAGLNVISVIQYMKTLIPEYNTLSMLLSTILFGFIMIESIICSYFRTDGFTL
jgi:hypothetical protein